MRESIIPGNSLGKLARNLFLIGLFFHLVAAWLTVGYHHPDEYFQVVEFASYKLGITPVSDLAWEYGAGIRPALQPAMIYCLCKITNLTNPVLISFLLRLVSAVTAWLISFLFVFISLKECRSDKIKKIILYLATFLWFIPYIHARFSAENWSAIFFFSALSMLMLMINPWSETFKYKIKPALFPLLLCGMLLGLSFVTRFQSGFMILGLGLWLLVFRKLEVKKLFILFAGIACSIGIGILTDRWFYNKWIFTAISYFRVNILEGKTADWGTSPWWDYFSMILQNNIPPFSIVILAGIFIFFFRFYKHSLTWICVPFLLIHILIGHKDVRFLFPVVNALPVVIGLSLDDEIYTSRFRRAAQLLSSGLARTCAKVFIIINLILMIVTCLKPANEIFSFYDYMYEECGNRRVFLYTCSGDPYSTLNLPVDFYRPRNLTVINISRDSLAHSVSFATGAKNLVFDQGLVTNDSCLPEGKRARMIFQTIPEWIKHFNFNNWLRHSRIWRIYEIEEGSGKK